jgi:hypothetical protein
MASLRRSPRLQTRTDERDAALALLSLRRSRDSEDTLHRARVEAAIARARRVDAAVARLTAPRPAPQPTRRSARIAARIAAAPAAEQQYIAYTKAKMRPRIERCDTLRNGTGTPSLAWRRVFFSLMDDWIHCEMRLLIRSPRLLALVHERMATAQKLLPKSRRARDLLRDLNVLTFMIDEHNMDRSLGR